MVWHLQRHCRLIGFYSTGHKTWLLPFWPKKNSFSPRFPFFFVKLPDFWTKMLHDTCKTLCLAVVNSVINIVTWYSLDCWIERLRWYQHCLLDKQKSSSTQNATVNSMWDHHQNLLESNAKFLNELLVIKLDRQIFGEERHDWWSSIERIHHTVSVFGLY